MKVTTPRDALIHEIALTLEAAIRPLGVVPVRRGFPASQSRDERFVLPAISVSVQTEAGQKRRRKVYRETVLENGFVEVLFEQETKKLGGTVEIWTKNKTEREPLELAVDTLLEGTVPDNYGTEEPGPPGLVLDLSLLYEARVRVLLVDKNEQDASGGRDGYFRILYSFEADVPYLIRREYKQATFTQAATVEGC